MARTRRLPSERILFAGDSADLPDIEAMLAHLPANAYGQVFVEGVFPEDVRIVACPPRVTVTWILRSHRASECDALVFADHGEALAQALVAWSGEWIGDDPLDGPTQVWIGCGASPWVEQARTVLHALEPAATGE